MPAVLSVAVLIAAFSLACMTYVYAFRGNVRPDSLREYLRKCWPVFAPFNCLLYMATEKRARRAVMDPAAFPELAEIRDNWEIIRDEAIRLHESQALENASSPSSQGFYDLGFRTFFKYGWRKFYINWYGYTHESARRQCPETVRIVSGIKAINGAMFTVLPPGSKLTRHSDPFACSLRYHLGLATPNSDDCWIDVDGHRLSWRDGEAFIFDETRLHHVANDTDQYRLILMCDIARPMNLFGRLINRCYRGVMRQFVVPNDASDRRGAVSALFASVTPLLARGKALKRSNRPLYQVLKFSINTVLAMVVIGLVAAVAYVPYAVMAG